MAYIKAVKEKFLDLRAQGWSFARISRELKVSIRTLIRWQGMFPSLIKDRKFFDFQEIIGVNNLSERALIEKKAKLADRLDGALAQRDLSKETLTNIVKMRNEIKEDLHRMLCDYSFYAGLNPDPETPEEYKRGKIGVE